MASPEHGVRVKGLELDLVQMLKRKDQVVKASNDGVVYLFKKNKVGFFHGRGSFVKAGTEGCEIAVGGETLSARNVIVATGSSPRALSGAAFDEKLILSNDGALAIPEVPNASRHRRGRDRAGNGQCVAQARVGGDDPRGAAGFPGRRRRADRQGSVEDFHQAGSEDRARRENHGREGQRRT